MTKKQSDTEKIQQARWLLADAQHAAMATVNEDGTPHNTPYFFIPSDDLQRMFWVSSPSAQHSMNIERTGEVYIVVYDAFGSGGVYIQCSGAREVTPAESEEALACQNKRREGFGKNELPHGHYDGREMTTYVASVDSFSIYSPLKDENDRLIIDERKTVSREELL